MIHPDTEVRFISKEKGYGLFATRSIPCGTVTWVKDQLDREISPQELTSYDPAIREIIFHYSYRDSRGNFIFCWDNTRFINHDCTPNCLHTAYNLELAVRDIHSGEEITNHYGTLNIVEPFTIVSQHEVTVYPDDLLRHGDAWDTLLSETFPYLIGVGQPLRPFISKEDWGQLEAISSGKQQMASITNCYFSGDHYAE